MFKRGPVIVVAVVIAVLGCLVFMSNTSKGNEAPKTYQQQMKELADTFTKIETEGQSSVQGTNGDPTKLLAAMQGVHSRKELYLRKLEAISPPEKFKEIHAALVEWRNKEQENESQMLEGMDEYAKSKSKAVEQKMEILSQDNEAIEKEFEAKTSAIAKKNGFDSVEKFLQSQ